MRDPQGTVIPPNATRLKPRAAPSQRLLSETASAAANYRGGVESDDARPVPDTAPSRDGPRRSHIPGRQPSRSGQPAPLPHRRSATREGGCASALAHKAARAVDRPTLTPCQQLRPRGPAVFALSRRTSSDSAAFARASRTALAGEGRAAAISRARTSSVWSCVCIATSVFARSDTTSSSAPPATRARRAAGAGLGEWTICACQVRSARHAAASRFGCGGPSNGGD